MGEVFISQQVTWFTLDEEVRGQLVSSVLKWTARDPLAMTIDFMSEIDVT